MSTICPKCGGTEHFVKEVNAQGGDGPNLLPIGWFTTATLYVVVCGGCGHVEFRVPTRLLPKVKEKFERVP